MNMSKQHELNKKNYPSIGIVNCVLKPKAIEVLWLFSNRPRLWWKKQKGIKERFELQLLVV